MSKPKKITKDERVKVMAYVSELLDLLGLGQCTVVLQKTTCDGEENDATIGCIPDTTRGLLTLSEQWMSFSDSRKAVVLIHEVLHLATAPMCQTAKPDDMPLGRREAFNTAEETAVDNLAMALRPLLPQYPGTRKSVGRNVFWHDLEDL